MISIDACQKSAAHNSLAPPPSRGSTAVRALVWRRLGLHPQVAPAFSAWLTAGRRPHGHHQQRGASQRGAVPAHVLPPVHQPLGRPAPRVPSLQGGAASPFHAARLFLPCLSIAAAAVSAVPQRARSFESAYCLACIGVIVFVCLAPVLAAGPLRQHTVRRAQRPGLQRARASAAAACFRQARRRQRWRRRQRLSAVGGGGGTAAGCEAPVRPVALR